MSTKRAKKSLKVLCFQLQGAFFCVETKDAPTSQTRTDQSITYTFHVQRQKRLLLRPIKPWSQNGHKETNNSIILIWTLTPT